MLKKAVQQGRSKRRGEAYASVRWASERCENAAGGLFQHPARSSNPTWPGRHTPTRGHEPALIACLTWWRGFSYDHPTSTRIILAWIADLQSSLSSWADQRFVRR